MKYTEEERAFLREYIPGHHHCETTEEFSKRFRPIMKNQVKAFAKNNGILTGFKACEGMHSWNKGAHYNPGGRCRETQFKPGSIPKQCRPVGSERHDADGYLYVKYAEPNKWKQKHRLVWEKANRPVGKDEVVVFLDRDRTNCELDNLRCIPRAMHKMINQLHLDYCNAETFEAACAAAELSLAIAEAKRRRKRNRGQI